MPLLLICLLCLLPNPQTQQPTPVKWLTGPVVDLGTIPHDQEHELILQYRNISQDSIMVDNVRVGCGCTASDWEEVPVAPGEMGSLKVSYAPTGRGKFRKYLKVYFVGQRGGHKLWLTGLVD